MYEAVKLMADKAIGALLVFESGKLVGIIQTVEECMALVTAKRIRHLPVLAGDRLIGIVSIGDLVKDIISEQEFMIQ